MSKGGMAATRKRCPKQKKVCYPSRKAAHMAMRTAGNRVRAYQCPHCKRWHVTREK